MRRRHFQLPFVLAAYLVSVAAATIAPAAAAEAPHADPATAATRPAAVFTYHDLYRQSLELNRQTLAEAYKRVGKHDPKWDTDATEFLELLALHATGSDVPAFYRPPPAPGARERMTALGQSLADSGCDDPLVLYAYGALLPIESAAGRAKAADVLRRAVAGLRTSKYPKLRVAPAMSYLARLTDDRAESAKLVAEAYEQLPSLCRGTVSGIDRRMRVGYVASQLQNRNQQRTIVESLKTLPDADPWIRDVLTGRLHIALAWDSRGNGPGNAVSEEAWKGFYANLAQARDALTRAWKTAPELPEAPREMIGVAMGGGNKLGEDKLDWFDRALKAQIDYEPAYTAMLQASLPRWGGSYDEMIRLADACVQKPRFDTLIPWQYVQAVKLIGEDAGKPWAPLSKPAVYEQFVTVVEGYAEQERPGSPRGDHYKSLHAAAAVGAQRLPEARKTLDELIAAGGKPDPEAFNFLGADDPVWTISSIYALTGPDAAGAKEALELAKNPETRKQSLTKLRAIQTKLAKDDPATPFYTGAMTAIDAGLKLEAGEWSPLVRAATLRDWMIIEGDWSISADGAITGWNRTGGPKTLLWRGRTIGRDPGRVFEVAGTVEFLNAGKVAGEKPQAGSGAATKPMGDPPALNSGPTPSPATQPDSSASRPAAPATVPAAAAAPANHMAGLAVVQVSSRRRGFAVVNFGGQNAGFVFGPDQAAHRAKVKNFSDFLVRVDDHTLTLFLDGKQVGQPYALGEAFAGEFAVGIGAPEGSPVRFTNLRVRKLGVKQPAKGGDQ